MVGKFGGISLFLSFLFRIGVWGAFIVSFSLDIVHLPVLLQYLMWFYRPHQGGGGQMYLKGGGGQVYLKLLFCDVIFSCELPWMPLPGQEVDIMNKLN